MKRLPVLLLGLSLVANAALVWKLAASNPVAPVESAKPDPSSGTDSSAGVSLVALETLSPTALVARLRAARINESLIEAIVRNRVRDTHAAALAVLGPAIDKRALWWRFERTSTPEKKAQAEERKKIEDKISAETHALLGLPPPLPSDADVRYAFLSPEKIAALKQLENDYQNLSRNNPRFAGLDMENLALIETERRTDIQQLLTPEELAEYELRFSETAERLRSRISDIAGTESEYRRLYALHSGFDQKFPKASTRGRESLQQRSAASLALQAEILRELGPERGGDYLWPHDQDYLNMKQVARQLSLPPDTAVQFLILREEIGRQGVAIGTNAQLDLTQQYAALAELAALAREKLNALVPADTQSSIPPKTTSWIDALADGKAAAKDPISGSGSSITLLPQTSKKPAPPRG